MKTLNIAWALLAMHVPHAYAGDRSPEPGAAQADPARAKGGGKKGGAKREPSGPRHGWRKHDVVVRGRLVPAGNFFSEGDEADLAPRESFFDTDTGDEPEGSEVGGFGIGGSAGVYLAKPFGRTIPVSPGIQYHRDRQWHTGRERVVIVDDPGGGIVAETELDRARYFVDVNSVAASTQFPLRSGSFLMQWGVDIGYIWGSLSTRREARPAGTVDTRVSGALFAVTWAVGGRVSEHVDLTVDLPLLQAWAMSTRDPDALPWKSTTAMTVLKVPLALGLSAGF